MNGRNDEQQMKYVGIGIPLGTGFGVALGLVLMNILDQPGFFALGIGVGASLGATIGLVADRLKGKNDVSN